MWGGGQVSIATREEEGAMLFYEAFFVFIFYLSFFLSSLRKTLPSLADGNHFEGRLSLSNVSCRNNRMR